MNVSPVGKENYENLSLEKKQKVSLSKAFKIPFPVMKEDDLKRKKIEATKPDNIIPQTLVEKHLIHNASDCKDSDLLDDRAYRERKGLDVSNIFSSLKAALLNDNLSASFRILSDKKRELTVLNSYVFWNCIIWAHENSSNERFLKYLEDVSTEINKNGNKQFQYDEHSDYSRMINELPVEKYKYEIIDITVLRALQFGANCHKYSITPFFDPSSDCYISSVSIPLNAADTLLKSEEFIQRHLNIFREINLLKITDGDLIDLYNPMEEQKLPKSVYYEGTLFEQDRGYKNYDYKKDQRVAEFFSKMWKVLSFFPYLTELDCSGTALRFLNLVDFPLIEHYDVSFCKNLTEVNLPDALRIKGYNIPHLKKVSAISHELSVEFKNCPELVSLYCPNATGITLKNIAVESLEFKMDAEILLKNCKKLKSMIAEAATSIELDGNDQLEELFISEECDISGDLSEECKVLRCSHIPEEYESWDIWV